MRKTNKTIKYIFVFLIVTFGLLTILALRPITTLHKDDCISVDGVIIKVWGHEKSKDINIRIGDGRHYYINRGLEKGLIESQFSKKIMNKEITIHYADHWTPLDPSGKVRHVARVSHGEEILYDEIVE